MSISKRLVRPFVEEYTMKDNRHIYILGEGRLINPSPFHLIKDRSVAMQTRSLRVLLHPMRRAPGAK